MRAYTADTDLASIRLVACDMDRTLLADDKSQPPHMAERIDALAAAGVLFCPASGRPGPTLREMFPEHAAQMAFIADNGGAITYRDELIYKSLIDPALYHELARTTIASGAGVPVLCAFDRAYVPAFGRAHHDALSVYYHDIIYVEDLAEVTVEANKFTVLVPTNDSKRWYDEVFAPAFGDALSVACAGIEWIDFMNVGVDKGAGLAHLAELLGIDLADTAAVGDTYNDTEMLDAAGHSFIVANATPDMREHASFELPSNNDRGVAVLIDAILTAKGAHLG